MLFPLLLLAQLLAPLAQSTTLWQQQLLLLVLYVSFFALLGGMIYLCTDINKKGALYCAVWSLLIAQCAYESWCFLELQFTRFGHPLNMACPWSVLVQLLAGAVFFAAVYILLARQLPFTGEYNIGPRQLCSACFIGILFMAQAAVPLLPPGASVIITASAEYYTPNKLLLDYAASKSAVTAFGVALSKYLLD